MSKKARVLSGIKIVSSDSENDYQETKLTFDKKKISNPDDLATPMPTIKNGRDVTIMTLENDGFEYDSTIKLGSHYFHITTCPLSFTCFVLCDVKPECNIYNGKISQPFLSNDKINKITEIASMHCYGTMVFMQNTCCVLLPNSAPSYYTLPSDIVNTDVIMFYPIIRFKEFARYPKETLKSASRHSYLFSWSNNEVTSQKYDLLSNDIIHMCNMIIYFTEYRQGMFDDLHEKRSELIEMQTKNMCSTDHLLSEKLMKINLLINSITTLQSLILEMISDRKDSIIPLLELSGEIVADEYGS